MDPRFIRAEEIGIRLEIVGGLPIWEASPVWKHQKAIDRIRDSITPGLNEHHCLCIHAADVYVAFPDGSLKRPDISIFCREPDEVDRNLADKMLRLLEMIASGVKPSDRIPGVPRII